MCIMVYHTYDLEQNSSLPSKFKDLNARSGLGEVLVHHHVHVLSQEKLFPICLHKDLRENFLEPGGFSIVSKHDQ